jgi:hypothetical protein
MATTMHKKPCRFTKLSQQLTIPFKEMIELSECAKRFVGEAYDHLSQPKTYSMSLDFSQHTKILGPCPPAPGRAVILEARHCLTSGRNVPFDRQTLGHMDAMIK